MGSGKLNIQNIGIASEVILGVLFLMCGCFIYLLFRSENINLYQWCSSIGLTNSIEQLRNRVSDYQVSEFARFSLPDGLYCASYILVIDALWHNEKIMRRWIVALIPAIALLNEILQFFGVVNGTFDWYDLICYSTPLLLYYFIFFYFNKTKRL